MMRILLVGPNLEDNLSLRYLSGTLKAAGHEARIVPFNSMDDGDEVVALCPQFDAVGLSIAFQARAREFLNLAERLKQHGVAKVVAGGHYASCSAETLLEQHKAIDLIVIHEGEQTIVDLADCRMALYRLPEIPGIVYRDDKGRIIRTQRRQVLQDLDRLPFPDRSGPVHLFAGVPTAYLMGSRGCLSNCDYCCITTLHRMAQGKRFRQRDPECIADEMAELYHHKGYRHFVFHDDNFLVPSVAANHRRLDAFEKAFQRRGLKDIGITLKCRPPDASLEILRRLKSLGLLRVFLGVESASAEGLQSIGRKQTIAQSERALETCQKLGISSQYTIMTFHPDATMQTLRADVAFMRKHLDHALNVARTEIYAMTPLEQRMIREGRAVGDYLARSYRIADTRVDYACRLFCRLFSKRAWAMRGLQDRVIGMDHLSAVLGHFYDDPEVRKIREAIRHNRIQANRDLVDLLEEIIDISSDPMADCEQVRDRIETLVAWEQRTRQQLYDRFLEHKNELNAFVRSRILLDPLASRPGGAVGRPIARHATAVALALSVAACLGDGRREQQQDAGGINEAAPYPIDASYAQDAAPDGAHPPLDASLDHEGISEMAPPPLDASLDHEGISEMAPPPLDASLLDHDGISEAPPPPLIDSDVDGLVDDCELEYFGTDPKNEDTDGDGIADGQEDHDSDGISNIDQQQADTWSGNCLQGDQDGLYKVCEEEVFGTDPEKLDTDGDGTSDAHEDHDGDGISNLTEQSVAGLACEDESSSE